MKRWLMLGGLAAVVAAGAWFGLAGDEDGVVRIPYGDREAVARGKQVYAEACASCHGADLAGEPNWRQRRPNGRLPAPPHDETGHTWHHPDADLFAVTKYGVAKLAPPGYESDMPAFEDQLSDEDILASLAYIKSTWPPEIQRRHDAMNGRVQ